MDSGAIWMTDGDEKRTAVRGMFAELAPVYDRLNGIMTLRAHGRWRRIAVRMLDLKPGESAIDVCTGTGDFLKPLRDAVGPIGFVAGVDFCAPMLERAADKPANALSLGDACALPFRCEAVDAVTVGWGIRNVPDVDRAHAEIARILRPGGRFVSIDMAMPVNPIIRAVYRAIALTLLPALGGRFGVKCAYVYLPKSVERFKTREELALSMRKAGFTDVKWRDLLFGAICIHFGHK